MNRAHGLRPDGVDYNLFEINDDGKTLYWTPGCGKRIRMTTTRGWIPVSGFKNIDQRIQKRWRKCTAGIAGLTEYQSGTPGLTGSAEKTVRQADKDLPGDTEDIELKELPGVANSAGRGAEQVETALANEPSDNAAWARRELAGLQEAMTRVRDELMNNLAKFSALDDERSG